ncbi:MAG: PilZ domain-containing protein [Firmicutes bacterium]|jgi:c-di-GMP-binding flagellar brake protein YcgR|nr:PilZ domain-containing protein [Bacillota bacterium]
MHAPAIAADARITVRNKSLEGAPRFKTKVERVLPHGAMIYAPLTDDYRSVLSPGDEVELGYPDRGAVYYYDSEVVSEVHDRVRLLEISEPRFNRREQRREHVRVEAYMYINYAVPTDEPEDSLTWKKAVTRDISGGGLALYLGSRAAELAPGTRVKILIPLDADSEPVEIEGEIVRVEAAELGKKPGTCAGVRFTRITEGQRTMVVRFVFARQRMLIKNSRRQR